MPDDSKDSAVPPVSCMWCDSVRWHIDSITSQSLGALPFEPTDKHKNKLSESMKVQGGILMVIIYALLCSSKN